MTIRILQVVGTMDLGGAETFIMNIYRNIDREKLQFDFLCHNRIEAKYTEEIIAMGGRMFCIPGITHGGIKKYLNGLYDFFVQHPEYKVVHAHQNDLNGIILWQAKRAGIKHCYSHSHTVYTNKNMFQMIKLILFRQFVNKYTTDAFACSIPAGEGVYRGHLKTCFEVISNGIDTKQFKFDENIRKQIWNDLNIKNGPVVGHVGRFSTVKNHVFLINVFNSFLRMVSSATLILIGEGELLVQIKDLVEQLGIGDNVRFLGARRDVNLLMNGMDIFLFPSIKEGLPVSVVEAQTSGLQVLTSDSISEETVITDLVHRLSLNATIDEWTKKMICLYEKSQTVERTKYSYEVYNKGFDALEISKKMEERYLADCK